MIGIKYRIRYLENNDVVFYNILDEIPVLIFKRNPHLPSDIFSVDVSSLVII